MKNITLIIVSLIALPSFASSSLKLANIDGWKTTEVEAGLDVLYKGTELLLFVTDKNDEEAPVIRVKTLGDAPSFNPRRKEAWKNIAFANQRPSQIIMNQTVLSRDGNYRYIAEFQTDIGTDTMLSSVLMSMVVNGKVRVFLFEQRPAEYKKSKEKVKKLFREVSVSADKT